MKNYWTEQEINKLKQLLDEHKTVSEIAEALNRSKHAVYKKVGMLGLAFKTPGSRWTQSEIDEFFDDWTNSSKSIEYLCKKYNRTRKALAIYAYKHGLGGRIDCRDYFTVQDLVTEMGIADDIIYRWIDKGLPVKVSSVGHNKYIIDQDKLLEWLKNNQDRFDASKISELLFIEEPQWLKDKRIKDKLKRTGKKSGPWTINEEKRLISLLSMGRSYDEIAITLNRSKQSVKDKVYNIKHRQSHCL